MKLAFFLSVAFCTQLLPASEPAVEMTLTPSAKNTLYRRIEIPENLLAGNHLITTELRADSPSPNAAISVSVETDPKTEEKPALPQTIPIHSSWTPLTLPIILKTPGRVTLILNKSPATGSFKSLQIKTIRTKPYRPEPGRNLLLNNGFFSGDPGTIPAQWRKYSGYTNECGLTGEFGFQNASTVMRLKAAGKAACIQGMNFPLPREGNLELTVHARALSDSAAMTLLLIGDRYAWGGSKSFSLNKNWQKFSLRLPVPLKAKSPFFWPRIDVAPNSDILIGQIEVIVHPVPPTPENRKENRIFNPSFHFGTLGWQLRGDEGSYSSGKFLKAHQNEKRPYLLGDTLIIAPGTLLQSRTFSVTPGKPYTARIRMKNAIPGKKATCSAFLIDGKWNFFFKRFELTDEYQTCLFSGTSKPSLYNRMYLRLDAGDNPVQIKQVQVTEGKTDHWLEPELEMGITGRNILFDTERNAPLELRVLPGKRTPDPLTVQLTLSDAFGKTIRTETFRFSGKGDQKKRFTVNPDGQRGVFHITLTAEGKKSEFRYAVLKDLSALTLSDPPLAGHLSPFQKKYDPDLLKKIFGFQQMTYTRFFGKEVLDLQTEPEFRKTFLNHHKFNVLSLPGIQDQNADFAVNPTITPELEKSFAAQIRESITKLKGGIQGVELFNEPELWRYQKGEKKNLPTMSPQKVARYYQIARKVIREVDPSIKILGPVAWRDYGFQFLESGGADAIDIYAFHGYSESPSLFNLYGKIMEYRKVLKEKFGRDIPIWNTEQYFGFRGSGLPDHDAELSRHYFKDTELEHAAVCVDNLIHHAAAGAKCSTMVLGYFLHGIPGQKEQMVFDSLAAVNAAQEILSNAGRGEELNLGEAVKSFAFPNAPGGTLVTLCTLDPATKGSMTIPENVHAFDFFGNRIQSATAPISIAPIYLRIPVKNWKAILNNLEFRDLGAPFALRLSMGGKNTLNLTLSNRTNKSEQLEVELTGIPKEIQLERTKVALALAPGEKRILSFPILQSNMRPMERYEFKATLRSRFGHSTERTSLSVLFAPRSANGRDVPWIPLNSDNLSTNYNPTEKWSGNDDLSAQFRTWWNRDGFGLSVRVHDNRFVFPDNAPAAWQNDSVQVYFDMKRDATPTSGKEGKNEGDDCDYILSLLHGKTPVAYLNHGSDARFIGEGNQTCGIDSALQLSCERPDAHTLIYHVFFPAATLPYISFREGTSFGFSLLINDDDGKGRKDGLTLAPKGTEPFRNPHLYKDLLLLP